MAKLQISNFAIDFETIKTQFTDDLLTKDAWRDILPTGVGQTLIEWYAAIATYEQYAIERALQETMPDTARLNSSILTITRMLGVHILRKIPAVCTANIQKINQLTSVEIPAYTPFSFGNNNNSFFNREAIFFNADENGVKEVKLYEGKVVTEAIIATGGAYQKYYLSDVNKSISDLDIICTTIDNNNQAINLSKVTDGLWRYPSGTKVFYEATMPDGRIEIIFGNENYGYVPSNGQKLIFTYVKTSGLGGNISYSGETVTSAYSTGITTSVVLNGSNEKTGDFYKNFAPQIFAATENKAVTKHDLNAIILTHPGVIDGYCLGQAETYPDDPRYMNIVEYTIITSTEFSVEDYTAFETWLTERSMYSLKFVKKAATPVNFTISAEVFCKTSGNLDSIKSAIETALTEFFTLKPGKLGESIYISDIFEIISNAEPNVAYIKLLLPTEDIIIAKPQYLVLTSIELTMNYTTRKI